MIVFEDELDGTVCHLLLLQVQSDQIHVVLEDTRRLRTLRRRKALRCCLSLADVKPHQVYLETWHILEMITQLNSTQLNFIVTRLQLNS